MYVVRKAAYKPRITFNDAKYDDELKEEETNTDRAKWRD